MNRQCESYTVRGQRCRRQGTEYHLVMYTGLMREFLVCAVHAEAARLGTFRPAGHPTKETA